APRSAPRTRSGSCSIRGSRGSPQRKTCEWKNLGPAYARLLAWGLGLLLAGRRDPGVLGDLVVHGGGPRELLLRLLGLDELRDPLLPEHPVVDPPLPPVVQGRLLALRREDPGVLEHVEGVPVLRLEDVVDDPLRVAEEVQDVLGHRPGLLLLHARPVDRVLDRAGEVLDGQAGDGPLVGLRLNRHGASHRGEGTIADGVYL